MTHNPQNKKCKSLNKDRRSWRYGLPLDCTCPSSHQKPSEGVQTYKTVTTLLLDICNILDELDARLLALEAKKP